MFCIGILFSCSSDDDGNPNTELIGTWQLVETLIDPGDGSGTFEPIESDKVIIFGADGTIFSNGNLCDIEASTDNPTSGTYSTANSTFSSPDCNNPGQEFSFERNGNILIIHYPCIEPCQAKYMKI